MAVALQVATLAREILRDCLEQDGQVVPSKHFRDQLNEEELTIPDAWHVLRTGTIFDPAEKDVKTGEWKYKIEGKVPDGLWVAIVFCFNSADRAVLITIFSVGGGASR